MSPQQPNAVAYHLRELSVALDSTDPRHCNPPVIAPGLQVLDVGCGAGQTLIAACPQHQSFGMDIDLDALRLGRTLTNDIAFVCARAEPLSFRNASFDMVLARVSLPYTDFGRSLAEIRRVLRPGGSAWMVLHPFSIPWASFKQGNWRGRLFFLYVALNSAWFRLTSRMIPFVNGRYESFQTVGGIRRALLRAGFREISVRKTTHFVASAK
jgi:ubiquinone/menaquinone biosynthesis C-methylase UbiE